MKSSGTKQPAARKPAPKRTPKPAKARTPAPSGARVIAVANQKGGVGKSTTAVSLGAALAELGYRTLVVDLDPQGNASTGLGIRHEAREVTVYDVLAVEAPIQAAIVQTALPNLYAIPSTIDLAGAEIELVSQFSRELRLRKALEPLKAEAFDFIFLDCPPSLGLLTVNALAAAQELIVPIQCEYYALEGLGQLLRNVKLVQQNVNTALSLTGIVMTMFDPRTKLSEQVVEEVRRYFGDRVYRTIIPRTVRLSEAPGFGQPITTYDPGSKGAQCYRDLAKEVADRLPEPGPLPVMDDLPAARASAPEPKPARAPRPLVREGAPARERTLPRPKRPEAVGEQPGPPEGEHPEARSAQTVHEREGEAETLPRAEAEAARVSAPSEAQPAPEVEASDTTARGVEPEAGPAEPEDAPEVAPAEPEPSPAEEWVRQIEAEPPLETEASPPRVDIWESKTTGTEPGAVVETEPGHVIVIDEGTQATVVPPEDEPEPELERRGFRGLFRRGGSR